MHNTQLYYDFDVYLVQKINTIESGNMLFPFVQNIEKEKRQIEKQCTENKKMNRKVFHIQINYLPSI